MINFDKFSPSVRWFELLFRSPYLKLTLFIPAVIRFFQRGMASRSVSLRRLRTHASKLSAGDQEGHHHRQQGLVSSVNRLPALLLACCNQEINLLLFNRGQLQLDRVTPVARTTTLRTRARAPLINTFETNALGFRLLKTGGRYRSSPNRLTGTFSISVPRSILLVAGCGSLCRFSSLRQGALLPVGRRHQPGPTSATVVKGAFRIRA